MPPKDDDEAPTTKEVVSKKHKQMLNREELDLSLIAEAFGGLLMEAPKKKNPGGEFKEPPKQVKIESEPFVKPTKKQSKILQRMADPQTSSAAAERLQSGLESKPAKPSKYEFDSKTGRPTRKSVINYATEVETRGAAGGRRTPKEVQLTPDDIAKRVRSVADTASAADKGNVKAQQQLQKWEDALTKKHGPKPTGVEEPRGGQRIRSRITGRTRQTRTSATTPEAQLRTLQGKPGQQPLDPALQRAASRGASGEPRPPEEMVGGESKPSKGQSRRARARGQAQAQGAGRPGRGSSGRSGGQILKDLIGKEVEIDKIKADIEKRDAQTAANRKRGAAKAKATIQRKATAAAIRAQDTAKVRSTPKPGGPLGGYKPTPTGTPANVARQMKVDPRAARVAQIRQQPSAQPRGASGGDAGAAVRRAMQQRAADAAKPTAPKPTVAKPPSVPRRVAGTLAKGTLGTGAMLGLGYGIEKLPVDRQTKDKLQTTVGVAGAALTPVASTLLSIPGSTPQPETTKPSASDTATAYKSDPNKVTVTSGKPAYDPKNPYDITKWKFRWGWDKTGTTTTHMTKAELDKLTKAKFPDLRGSVTPGSVVPKGFVSADPELAARTERERQRSTGTTTQTQTAAPPAAAPPKVKVDTKVDEPKPKPKPTPRTIPGVSIGPGGFQVTPSKTTRSPKGDKKGRLRLPGLGFPQQPGGKIGRRANPQ